MPVLVPETPVSGRILAAAAFSCRRIPPAKSCPAAASPPSFGPPGPADSTRYPPQQPGFNARDRIAPLKRGDVTDPNIFADVAGKVDALRRQYCRLAACFLVFKNQTQKNALRDAKEFGVTITPDVPRANPLRYTAIFFVAIMIAIYLGVSLSAMTWDLLRGDLDAALNQDPDLLTKWIGYALAIYGIPILVH